MAYSLAMSGIRVLLPNLRGRGASGLSPSNGGYWTYDDLVLDVGSLVDFAVAQFPQSPVSIVGHSLFGHASMAFLSSHPDYCVRRSAEPRPRVVSCVIMASNTMLGRIELDYLLWLRKCAVILFAFLVSFVMGYVPARSLGLGTCDESYGFFRALLGFVFRSAWKPLPNLPPAVFTRHDKKKRVVQSGSKPVEKDAADETHQRQHDGLSEKLEQISRPTRRVDYCPGGFDAGLSQIAAPVLCISSLGDSFEGVADSNMLFPLYVPKVDYVVMHGTAVSRSQLSIQLGMSIPHALDLVSKLPSFGQGTKITPIANGPSDLYPEVPVSKSKSGPKRFVKDAPTHVGIATDWKKSGATWHFIGSWVLRHSIAG